LKLHAGLGKEEEKTLLFRVKGKGHQVTFGVRKWDITNVDTRWIQPYS